METPALRRCFYQILGAVTVAAMTARIASAERVYEPSLHRADPRLTARVAVAMITPGTAVEATAGLAAAGTWSGWDVDAPGRVWPMQRPFPMPTYGSNDRSRWATIRALVEDGTFVIGRREHLPDGTYRETGRIFEPGYDSVDKVKDPTTNRFYSSKPPLLTVLLAGEYWLLTRLGFDLDNSRWIVVRVMVWTANVLPLAVFFALFARVIERHGRTDWGRPFTFAAACFGTFLTTFSVTLNNHVPAAVAAFLAVYPWLTSTDDSPWTVSRLLASGLFAGLAASFELPAAALLGGLFVGLLVRTPVRTVFIFAPIALIPLVVQAGLTYQAVGEPWPVYAKISETGEGWYHYPGSHWLKRPGEVKRGIDWAGDYESRGTYAFHLLAGHHGVFSLTPVWVLSVFGMLMRRRDDDSLLALVLLLTLLVSLAVIVFFAAVVGTVNYGGWTSGARWFFWLAPLWLVALLPAADGLAGSRFGRSAGLLCLAVSVFSASYPAWNPWRHPWLYNLVESAGAIPYGK